MRMLAVPCCLAVWLFVCLARINSTDEEADEEDDLNLTQVGGHVPRAPCPVPRAPSLHQARVRGIPLRTWSVPAPAPAKTCSWLCC